MSDNNEINSNYLSTLTKLIEKQNSSKIKKMISNLHVADIAVVIEYLDTKHAKYFYNLITNEKILARVLTELEDDTIKKLLKGLPAKEIAEKVIENLETDDAVDIIKELTEEKKEKVLSHLEDVKYANDINDLLSYELNTAGSLMGKELIKVNENWHTVQCLKEMRKQANSIKTVYTIYVVDDNDKLLGLMSLRRLLLTERTAIIKEIMFTDIISIKANDRKEDVANIMQKYDLVALPVVDNNSKLLGRITIDDVMDVAKEEAEKNYQMASGISEDIESSDGLWQLTRARLPWLLIGLLGGVLGAKTIGFFHIEKNFELVLFIPLIAAMGGNVGIQSAAIVVQGLANDSLKMENVSKKLLKELAVGILNGIICSTIILVATFVLGYNIHLSLAVSISLLVVIVFAAMCGTFIPLTLDRQKIDPALATGPFITTINDILGLFIYFWIGQLII